MPYRIVKDDEQYCVQKTTGDKDTMGCHATEDEALAQMRALYAADDDN